MPKDSPNGDNELQSPTAIRFTLKQTRWLERMMEEDGCDLATVLRAIVAKEGKRRGYASDRKA